MPHTAPSRQVCLPPTPSPLLLPPPGPPLPPAATPSGVWLSVPMRWMMRSEDSMTSPTSRVNGDGHRPPPLPPAGCTLTPSVSVPVAHRPSAPPSLTTPPPMVPSLHLTPHRCHLLCHQGATIPRRRLTRAVRPCPLLPLPLPSEG